MGEGARAHHNDVFVPGFEQHRSLRQRNEGLCGDVSGYVMGAGVWEENESGYVIGVYSW